MSTSSAGEISEGSPVRICLLLLVGIWIVTNVVVFIIPGDPVFFGIPLFKALIGAIFFAAVWYLLTYRVWHHRNPYYQRRVPV